MNTRPYIAVLFCLLPALHSAFGQDATTAIDTSADSTSANILLQAVNASGVSDPSRPVTDFTATGKITYFWAGEEVSGTATLLGRRGGQFRLDAQLPNGTRSIRVSRGIGWIKETDRQVRAMPMHNAINMGTMTFPILDIATSLDDPETRTQYLGSEVISGVQANRVRVQRTFSSSQDPDGTLAKLCEREYFIDPGSGLLVKTLDMIHPEETLTESYLHEMEFDNYSVFEGVRVPTLIREKIIGQTTWELQISNVTFNTGLTDANFELQQQ